MIWFLLSCFSNGEPEAAPPTLNTWADLAEHCPNGSCSPKMCNTFYASVPQPTEQDVTHLATLCSWLETDLGADAQFCSIKACLYLPTVSSEYAQKQLFEDQPNTAGKKMARQAILRTLINTPQEFSKFIVSQSATKHADRWLRIAVAEAECNENSIAHKLQMSCRERNPVLASVLWEWTKDLKEPSTQLTSLNLAMLADQQSILPKVINGLKTKEQAQMHKILGSVLQLALLKGVELNEKDQEYFKTMCNTAPPDLVHLCMSFR